MELLGWTGKPAIVLLNQLGAPRAAAMARLAAGWTAQCEPQFASSLDVLAAGLGRLGAARVGFEGGADLGERLRRIGVPFVGGASGDRAEDAQRRLAGQLQDDVRADTAQLLMQHGLQGETGRDAL